MHLREIQNLMTTMTSTFELFPSDCREFASRARSDRRRGDLVLRADVNIYERRRDIGYTRVYACTRVYVRVHALTDSCLPNTARTSRKK